MDIKPENRVDYLRRRDLELCAKRATLHPVMVAVYRAAFPHSGLDTADVAIRAAIACRRWHRGMGNAILRAVARRRELGPCNVSHWQDNEGGRPETTEGASINSLLPLPGLEHKVSIPEVEDNDTKQGVTLQELRQGLIRAEVDTRQIAYKGYAT